MAKAPFARMYKALLYSLMLCLAVATQAQQATARLDFVGDTLALGRPLQLSLSARYPTGYQLLLPDTARAFTGFEVVGLHRPPVVVQDGQRFDSITITLRSFSIAPKQGARLDLLFFNGADTLRATTNADSVRFVARVQEPVAAQRYKKDFGLIPLAPPTDYRAWAIVITLVTLLCGLAYYFLQAPLRRWLALRRLQREWQALQVQLAALQGIRNSEPLRYINSLNLLWKSYLETAQPMPLRSLTAREMRQCIAQLSPIQPDEAAALVALCDAEEQLNYAHRQPAPNVLDTAYVALQRVLQQAYTQRKGAVA